MSKRKFPENRHVEKVIQKLSKFGSVFQSQVLGEVSVQGRKLPIYGLQLGNPDPKVPVLGLFGGVHGLEKIGTHVIVNYFNRLSTLLAWDTDLWQRLEQMRIVSIPIVNPGGMFLNYRSNPNGVDLMRNAPIEADEKGVFLGSGQTYSPRLPWYRGESGKMEMENKILEDFVQKQMMKAPFSMALDIHSGFGWRDSLWYPYGKTRTPYADQRAAEVFARHLKVSHPYHHYKVEKQADSYLIHGDMWDYLYDQSRELWKHNKFLPWTLELGTWSWLLSRPHRLFTSSGLFHTEKNSDRYSIAMRKHWGLLEFFQKMTIQNRFWLSQECREENLDRIISL